MRVLKYGVSVLLFLAVALCAGELFQLHIAEAGVTDWVEFNLQDVPTREFYAALDKTAQESDVSVFYYDLQTEAAGQTVTLYASDDEAAVHYEQAYGIRPGVYKSLFLGDTTVRQAALTDCTVSDEQVRFGVLGSRAAEEAFLARLESVLPAENYAFGNRASGLFDSEAVRLLAALWAVACVLGAVLGLYETALYRKEAGVRYTLGEREGSLFLRRVGLDCAVFAALFLAVFGGLSALTYTRLAPAVTLAGFGAFLLANALTAVPLLRLDLQKALGNAASPGILAATYALKTLSCVLAAAVTAAVAGAAAEALALRRLGAFFYTYKDYNLVHFYVSSPDPTIVDENAMLDYLLQQELQAAGRALTQVSQYSLSDLADGKDRDGVVCNRFAKENVLSALGLSAEQLNEEKLYILVPDYPGHEQDLSGLQEWAAMDFDAAHETEIVVYESGVTLPALHTGSVGIAGLSEDPVVFLQNYDPAPLSEQELRGTVALVTDAYGNTVQQREGGVVSNSALLYTMLRTDAAYAEDFLARQGYAPGEVEITVTNVYESCRQTHVQAQRLLTLAGVCLAFLLLLEWIVTGAVIRLEYTINAKELAIKTVLGYSVLQKHRRVFALTFGTLLLGTLAAVLLSRLLSLGNPFWMVCAGALLALLELPTILYYARRTERARLVKILKGGSL